jgi:hypothetical protein
VPRTRVIRNVRSPLSSQPRAGAGISRTARVGVTLCALLVLCCSGPLPPIAGPPRTVSVRVLDRDVVAIRAGSSDSHLLPLEPGERVLSHEAHGRIGIAVTDRRVVGFTSASGWTERRLRVSEATPSRAKVGARVAIFLTSQRAIGFDGHWREANFSFQEDTIVSEVKEGTAVIVTNLRALGLSETSSGFHPIPMRAGEVVESAIALDTTAEVRTSERVLRFSGSWTESPRSAE